MKKAKSYKILILLAVFVFSVTAAFSMLISPFKDEAYAATVTADDPADYFSGVEDVAFENDMVVVTAEAGEILTFKNSLSVNALEIEFSAPSGIGSMTIILKSDSYYVNGNKNAEGGLDKEIENTLVIDFGSGSADFYFNDADKASGANVAISDTDNMTVSFSVENNMLSAGVNGTEIECADEYYKISGPVSAAKISVEATAADDSSAVSFGIVSVNQNTADAEDGYKQTFVLDEGKLTAALPVVAFSGSFKGYEKGLKVYNGTKYNVSFTVYSLIGGITASNIYLGNKGDSSIALYNTSEKPKDIQFNATGNKSFDAIYKDGDDEITLATFNVTVYDKEDDETAPEYNLDASATRRFVTALNKATLRDYGDEGEHSIPLGEDLTVPSMKELVSDDTTSYENLSHTIYYKTPSGSGSVSSTWDIPISQAGKYSFYVIFSDANGNKMLEEDFFTTDDEDENDIIFGRYGDYYFEFTVNDDAPMYVNSVTQGKAYVGIKHIASDFKYEDSGYKASYELYFSSSASANIDDDNWEENWTIVPTASSVSEDDEFAGELDYDDIVSIGYDGSLTFTPNKVGKFALKCTVASTSSVRSASSTAIIEVSDDVTTVKPDNHWLENNIWSVVFLSVGTLCLIGIVILLFVKPKEETEESTDEEIKK